MRHGTLSLIAGFDVASGRMVSSSMATTRGETDFAIHVKQLLETDPEGEWVLIADGLNTHHLESLVRLVATTVSWTNPWGRRESGLS